MPHFCSKSVLHFCDFSLLVGFLLDFCLLVIFCAICKCAGSYLCDDVAYVVNILSKLFR